jgi:hypothetical protein
MALAGIIEGAKNSIAAMSTVLTILRIFICRPQRPRKPTLNPNLVVRMAYDISATMDNDSVAHLTRDDLANAPSTTARSERTPETRTVHRHHHPRGYYAGVGPTLGSFDCSTVGVFVFLLRMPITGQMAGIAIEARRIAVNIAKLPELSA